MKHYNGVAVLCMQAPRTSYGSLHMRLSLVHQAHHMHRGRYRASAACHWQAVPAPARAKLQAAPRAPHASDGLFRAVLCCDHGGRVPGLACGMHRVALSAAHPLCALDTDGG